MNLTCACCGGSAPAKKQWWNRDTGYGCCPRCFQEHAVRDGIASAVNLYGEPGIHNSYERGDPESVQQPTCLSGLRGWRARVRSIYSDADDMKRYDAVYSIAKRLGYESAEALWFDNPLIEGSVRPDDLRVVKRGEAHAKANG